MDAFSNYMHETLQLLERCFSFDRAFQVNEVYIILAAVLGSIIAACFVVALIHHWKREAVSSVFVDGNVYVNFDT